MSRIFAASVLGCVLHSRFPTCLGLHKSLRVIGDVDVSFSTSPAADNLEHFKAPKWMQESNVTGLAHWECGHKIFDQLLPKCDATQLDIVRGWTHVLQENPGNISDVADRVFMIGEDSDNGIQNCIEANTAFPSASGSVHNPVRVVVDNEYVNHPSCCNSEEVNGLVLNDDGQNYPWTDDALRELENATECGLSFYRVQPAEGICTKTQPCPLVIQIAGAAGNPWFIVQSHCQACQKQLGATVIAPFLDKDMFTEDGAPAGSSNSVLKASLIPFLDDYLEAHPENDKDRVYVLAQSQGDDTALRLGLLRSDLISMVSLAGKNYISNETKHMLSDPGFMMKAQTGRLKFINWHVGDLDTAFSDEEYFPELRWQLSQFAPGYPTLELRLYPQSFHSVWWAAWNSLHQVVWTGTRTAAEASIAVFTTCRGPTRLVLHDDVN